MLFIKYKENIDTQNLVERMAYGLRLANSVNFHFKGVFSHERDRQTQLYYNQMFGVIRAFGLFTKRKIGISLTEEVQNNFETAY